MSTDARGRALPPPWLWFWVVFFILSVPTLFGELAKTYEDIVRTGQFSAKLHALNPEETRLEFLLYPAALLDVLPPAAMLLGLLVVLAPWLRRGYLERRFGLHDPPEDVQVLSDITSFVRARAAGLRVRCNLARGGDLAFVYPSGYGKTTLAVFGGLVKLWRTDRPAAEAVLLHEVAHYRAGDVVLIGAGSFFSGLFRYMASGFILFFLLPQFVLLVHIYVGGYLEMREIWAQSHATEELLSGLGVSIPATPPAPSYWEYVSTTLAAMLGRYLFTSASFAMEVARFVVLPLAAIWTAELHADRAVVEQQGSAEPLRRGLALVGTGGRWWRWLLFRLSHPPVRLRLWITHRRHEHALAMLILLFPLAYVLRLLILHARAMAMYVSADLPVSELLGQFTANSMTYFTTLMPVLWTMAFVLVAWPWLQPYWLRLSGGGSPGLAVSDRVLMIGFGVVFGVLATLALLLGG